MAAAISFHEGMEPRTIQEVYGRPDRSQWEEAMKEELCHGHGNFQDDFL